jgi:NAD(P)H dehydrogenase (quinone)
VNTLLIYCHPHDGSHNHRVLERVARGLEASGTEYELIDLYRADFDPRLQAIEYTRMFVTPETTLADDVRAYQAKVTGARNLVFIYPVWWYTMPAALKGFIDRVFTPGFAYRFRPSNAGTAVAGEIVSRIPGLRYLAQPYAAQAMLRGKRAYIFRTYGGPRAGRRIFGDTPTLLENVVLRFCGITDITIHEFYGIHLPTYSEAKEKRHLEKAERIAAGIRNA